MRRHREGHRTEHMGWLRAAVLGANDGIVSTASLLLGVLAAHTDRHATLLTGVATLVAGSMSMAAGEYVSVHSQADSEQAELAREREELATSLDAEHRELAAIYVGRGLDPELARAVAEQLMAHDALDAHARDELGITEVLKARPLQAAAASAVSFAIGALVPLLVVALLRVAGPIQLGSVFGLSLACLALLGATAARMGGASARTGALRVAFWGALAMGVTTGTGLLFGAAA